MHSEADVGMQVVACSGMVPVQVPEWVPRQLWAWVQLYMHMQVLVKVAGADVHANLETGAGIRVCTGPGMVQLVWVLEQVWVWVQQWIQVPVCKQVIVWIQTQVHILMWL